jgi:hypothetical protein
MWLGWKMTILPSTASLLARQVRLVVSPPTTTLFESRAILFHVQSRFGTISTFINQRNDAVLHRLLKSAPKSHSTLAQPPLQTILAVFDSPASKKSALDSDTLTIVCGGDHVPSAKELDPYNARSLHGRHHPPERTFTCQIVEEEDPSIHQCLAEKHPYSGPFPIDTLQMSYGDLVKAGAPLKGMADVMQSESMWSNEESPPVPSKGFYSDCDRLEDPQHNGGLMGAWRRGTEKQKQSKCRN